MLPQLQRLSEHNITLEQVLACGEFTSSSTHPRSTRASNMHMRSAQKTTHACHLRHTCSVSCDQREQMIHTTQLCRTTKCTIQHPTNHSDDLQWLVSSRLACTPKLYTSHFSATTPSLDDTQLLADIFKGSYGLIQVLPLMRSRQLHPDACCALGHHRIGEAHHVDTSLQHG